MFKKSYLYSVWNHDNAIVKWLIILFLGGTVFINIIGHEISPFFIWAMLSEKMYVHDEYEVIHIEVDGEPLIYSRKLWDTNRHYIRNTMSYYIDMKNNNEDFSRRFFKEKLNGKYELIESIHSSITNDINASNEFEQWYKRYLEKTLEKDINEIKIEVGYYSYSSDGKPQLIKKENFLEL